MQLSIYNMNCMCNTPKPPYIYGLHKCSSFLVPPSLKYASIMIYRLTTFHQDIYTCLFLYALDMPIKTNSPNSHYQVVTVFDNSIQFC